MDARAFGRTLVTLLVIMDPIGTAPIFVALTAHLSPAAVRRSALAAVGAAGGLIVGFALFGRVVLDYLGISLESLSISGGLLLLLVALEMLRGLERSPMATENVALVPIATPILAGPGAIAAIMVLVRRYNTAGGRIGVGLAIAVTVIAIGLVLLLAGWLSRVVRPSVIHFLTRVFGLLLSAVAVQLMVDGVRSLVRAG